MPDTDQSAIDIAKSWLQRLLNAAAPTKSIVGAYLNYIDPYLQDWQLMYYRDHWDRLREIKSKWDPTWCFRFPQGIPPNPPCPNAAASRIKSLYFVVSLTLVVSFKFFYA